MKLSKELKKYITEDYGITIESESPLTLTDDSSDVKDVMIGLIAELFVKEISEDMDEVTDFDISKLDGMSEDDMLLITANVNWADEMDLSEFQVMPVSEFKRIHDILTNHEDEIEWCIGSNQDISFTDGKSLLSKLTVKSITEDESDMLDDLFGGEFGNANVFENIYELEGDKEEEYDEDAEYDFLSKRDYRDIETLKQFGWTITVPDKDEYMLKYENAEGQVSMTSSEFLEGLVKHYKKQK